MQVKQPALVWSDRALEMNEPNIQSTPEVEKKRRFRVLPVRSLVPNILTVLALCSGLTSIQMALSNRWHVAVIAIGIAALLDGLDGRVARLLKGATKFGAELDSLTDFVNFGVAPVLLLYLWSLYGLGDMGWVIVLAFVVCCALRLARFNTALEDPDQPEWAMNFFVGVPSPAAAGLVLIPIYLEFIGFTAMRNLPELVALYAMCIALLMVAPIRTFSFKKARVKRQWVLPILVVVALLAALFINYPWAFVLALMGSYLCLIPFSAARYRKLLKQGAEDPLGEDEEEIPLDTPEKTN